MCGISGIVASEPKGVETLKAYLKVMNTLQAHRGPDDEGIWVDEQGKSGFGH